MNEVKRDTQVTRIDDSSFTGEVAPNWGINNVPNGGYLLAIMTNAVLKQSERKAPVQVTANYLGRSIPGSLRVGIETMAKSRTYDRFQVSSYQTQTKNEVSEEKETIRSFFTLIDDYDASNPVYENPVPEVLPIDQCKRLWELPGYHFFGRLNLLLEPECLSWLKNKKRESATQKGWIVVDDVNDWDAGYLMIVADAFPPPIMITQGISAWVPTIELSIQIRQLPKTRAVKCVYKSRYLTGNLLEADGEVWDEEGNLILISRQLAQYKQAEITNTRLMSLKAASAYVSLKNKFRK